MGEKTTIQYFATDYTGEILSAEELRNYLPISSKWELQFSDKSPDIVIIHSANQFAMDAMKARKKWGFKPFLLQITGESIQSSFPGSDYSISYTLDGYNNYYYPCVCCGNIYYSFMNLIKVKRSDSISSRRRVIKGKVNFCSFIYGNNSTQMVGVRKRIRFYKMLSSYKKIDCAGSSLNNTDKLKILEKKKARKEDPKIKFMKTYKFSIVFENKSQKGYFTEKIFHAFVARTIPIYYGDPNITDYFNPKAFINCHDYDSFEHVIERVIEIDQNPELLAQYLNEHPLHRDSKMFSYTPSMVQNKTDRILKKALKKRSNYAHIKYPHIYSFCNWIIIIIPCILSALVLKIKRYTIAVLSRLRNIIIIPKVKN